LKKLLIRSPGGKLREGRGVTVASKEVLTAAEAAELLQISTKTLLRLAREGELPGLKVGRCWRFGREELVGRLSRAATV
jgi:excisionase family DNA binding protein